MRIASGQKVDLNEIPEAEAGLRPRNADAGGADSDSNLLSPGLSSPGMGDAANESAGEDGLKQRAAMLLQDMRAGGDGADEATVPKREIA